MNLMENFPTLPVHKPACSVKPTVRVMVLVATYNGRSWIEEQLRSILDQQDLVVRVTVSDDLSTDGTWEWLQNLAAQDDRILLLPRVERFGGAARNFFRLIRDVDFSNFDYVSFADQDDIWNRDKLSRAHNIIINTGSDAYSSNVMAFWLSGRKIFIRKSQEQVKWDFLFEAAGPGCTYVIRKDLACAVQNLLKICWNDVQEVGLHDWFIYAFARANGYCWVIDDYAGMLYRQHEKNQVGVNSGIKAFFHRARMVLNGWGMIQSALIAQLVGLGDDPFVKRWSAGNRSGLLWLGLHAWNCRRRVRDKIMFSLSCVAMFLVGNRHQ